jgi:CheY-like chemotaxis protein
LPEKLIGDSTRLTQILFNLVGNAAKYTYRGRIEVQAAELPRVQDNICRVLFTISDTGAGIPDDKIDKIFETFTQAGNNLSPYTRQHEGAGLGLPLVKRLVKLMGGCLAIDSLEGAGTSVYVSLPFHLMEVAGSNGVGAGAERRHDHARGLKILVVENDRMTQFYLRKILEKSGIRAEIAENGQEALGMLNRSHFDCILMDVQMPVMDGVEATKRIRAMEGDTKNLPIIAMTAYAMSGDREKFLASGMDDYIAKPMDHDELMLVLKRNLSV